MDGFVYTALPIPYIPTTGDDVNKGAATGDDVNKGAATGDDVNQGAATGDGEHLNSLSDIVKGFNEFFSTIGGKLAECFGSHTADLQCPAQYENLESTFTFTPISDQAVLTQLKHLPVKKAPGLDNIHPRLLKHAAEAVTKPLTHIYNLSLSTGIIPPEWKSARVTPIHKGGDQSDPNNFRPISVLPVIMKILEREDPKYIEESLNSELDRIAIWFKTNRLTLNATTSTPPEQGCQDNPEKGTALECKRTTPDTGLETTREKEDPPYLYNGLQVSTWTCT
ncbi:hypothetical protein Bbelb_350150 [Branchiostoma belcheri]|nr:hypothetical protein Bbelb_350150 [Branchiostoma belcheri]